MHIQVEAERPFHFHVYKNFKKMKEEVDPFAPANQEDEEDEDTNSTSKEKPFYNRKAKSLHALCEKFLTYYKNLKKNDPSSTLEIKLDDAAKTIGTIL